MIIRRWEVIPVDRTGNRLEHTTIPTRRYFWKNAARRTTRANNRMNRTFKRKEMYRVWDRRYKHWIV